MGRIKPKLTKIDHNSAIQDGTFTTQLQHALLLALVECNMLNTIQFQHAEEKLMQQHRNQLSRMLDKENP